MIGIRQPALPELCPAVDARRPFVVELVGPAAAGKTSLLQVLGERGGGSVRVGLHPRRGQYLASALSLAPTFPGLHRPYRGVLWKEMKRIVYLHALQRLLQQPASANRAAVALDEGAVYMLWRLRVLGGTSVRSPAFERWWRRAIDQWAGLVDLVVWLDAADPVLTRRLRTRQQLHSALALPDDAIVRLLGFHRATYERVIGALTAAGHTGVIRIRTDQQPLTSVAEQVFSEIRSRAL